MAITDLGSKLLGVGTAGLGVGLASLFGAGADKKIRGIRAEQRARGNSFFDQVVNEVGMERNEAQNALARLREVQAQRAQAARGGAAVMGASAGSVAAEKNAQNLATAQSMGQLAAEHDANNRALQMKQFDFANDMDNQQVADLKDKKKNLMAAGSTLSTLGAGMFGPKTSTT